MAHCCACRLEHDPDQIISCHLLVRLELSFNPLELTDNAFNGDPGAARCFTKQRQLAVLGLRQSADPGWSNGDVEAIAKIQRNCTRGDGSAVEIVLCRASPLSAVLDSGPKHREWDG